MARIELVASNAFGSGFAHMYLVITFNDGYQWGLRGQAADGNQYHFNGDLANPVAWGDAAAANLLGLFGKIGPYGAHFDPKFPDYIGDNGIGNNPRVTIFESANDIAVKQKLIQMEAEANKFFNGEYPEIKYDPAYSNCNTVLRDLLKAAGLDAILPTDASGNIVFAPGFNTLLQTAMNPNFSGWQAFVNYALQWALDNVAHKFKDGNGPNTIVSGSTTLQTLVNMYGENAAQLVSKYFDWAIDKILGDLLNLPHFDLSPIFPPFIELAEQIGVSPPNLFQDPQHKYQGKAGTANDDSLDGTGGLQQVNGFIGNDTLIGDGNDRLLGGVGADKFVFGQAALASAQAATSAFSRVVDYDQGEGTVVARNEGDIIDVSGIVGAAFDHGAGSPVNSLVRAVAGVDSAMLQVDSSGSGASWTTIAQLDGLQDGDRVRVVLDQASAATTIAVGVGAPLPPTVVASVSPLDVSSLKLAGPMVTGQSITLTVRTSAAVTVNTTGGSPTLQFNDGGAAAYDASASDPLTGRLIFRYTAAASDYTTSLAITALNLNGSVIQDETGVDVDFAAAAQDLSFDLLGGRQASLAVNAAYATGLISSLAGELRAGDTAQLTLLLSKAVAVSGGVPTLSLSDGGTATFNAAGSDPSSGKLAFDYAVISSGYTPALTVTEVNLNGAVVNDTQGHVADFSGVVYLSANVQVRPAFEHPGDASRLLVFFPRSDAQTGTELWVTDNAGGAPRQVADIIPGTGSSDPRQLGVAGVSLYFVASDGVHGRELWRTDGTEGGTRLVKDIAPGTADSFISSSVTVGSILYFFASDGAQGRELWRSDGTSGGTFMVSEITPGSTGTTLGTLVGLGSQIFFTVDDGSHGMELWRSDGTAAGTAIVKDIAPGPTSAFPFVHSLTAFQGAVYFPANDQVSGTELWRSDGTSDGTVLLSDIQSGPAGSLLGRPTVANGQLLFGAYETTHGWELWRSDGTSGGTQLVKEIQPGSSTLGTINPTGAGAVAYFAATDGSGAANHGNELWRTDGTAEGTALVRDIRPGPTGSNPGSFLALDDDVFFTANDGTNGRELWRTLLDGGGATLLADVVSGSSGTGPLSMTLVGDDVYFLIEQGTIDGSTAGNLYRAGPQDGTELLAANAHDPLGVLAQDQVFFQSQGTGQVLAANLLNGQFSGWNLMTAPLGPTNGGWNVIGAGNVDDSGPELFVQNAGTGTIYYANRAHDSTAWGVVSASLTPSWKLLAVADVDGDGSDDSIIQNETDGTTYFASMLGGVFRGWGVVSSFLTSDWVVVGAKDIDGDRFADVVVQQQSTGTTYFANMASGRFSEWGLVTGNVTPDWKVKAVGDLTGDGFADVVFQNRLDGTTYYADMKAGTFDHWGVAAPNIDVSWVVRGASDIDADRHADVLVQHSNDGTTYYAHMGDDGFIGWGAVAANITSDWLAV